MIVSQNKFGLCQRLDLLTGNGTFVEYQYPLKQHYMLISDSHFRKFLLSYLTRSYHLTEVSSYAQVHRKRHSYENLLSILY